MLNQVQHDKAAVITVSTLRLRACPQSQPASTYLTQLQHDNYPNVLLIIDSAFNVAPLQHWHICVTKSQNLLAALSNFLAY